VTVKMTVSQVPLSIHYRLPNCIYDNKLKEIGGEFNGLQNRLSRVRQ